MSTPIRLRNVLRDEDQTHVISDFIRPGGLGIMTSYKTDTTAARYYSLFHVYFKPWRKRWENNKLSMFNWFTLHCENNQTLEHQMESNIVFNNVFKIYFTLKLVDIFIQMSCKILGFRSVRCLWLLQNFYTLLNQIIH